MDIIRIISTNYLLGEQPADAFVFCLPTNMLTRQSEVVEAFHYHLVGALRFVEDEAGVRVYLAPDADIASVCQEATRIINETLEIQLKFDQHQSFFRVDDYGNGTTLATLLENPLFRFRYMMA